MKLTRRVHAVERGFGGPFVTEAQVEAAEARMRPHLEARLRAAAFGGTAPAYALADYLADARVLNQWRRQLGKGEPNTAEIEAKMLAYVRELTGDPKWDWGQARWARASVEGAP